ncbi:hypothetical protein ACIBTP_13370 [Streptomyces avidinii]|uniref:hypothetical protein n=1 Tax=Streptomyces avidinii TaxID=1895 RepID=UPI0037982A15
MSEPAEPPVKIVRGAPDGTELAAVLLALLSAAGQSGGAPDEAEEQAAAPARAAWGPPCGWRPPGAWTARPVSRAAGPHRKDTDRR